MIIYKTTNLINGKFYIGKDSHNNPVYYGSGIMLNAAIRKYGKENFIKEIIDTADNEDELNEKEKYWIKETNAQNKRIGYNIASGGNVFDISTHPDIENIKRKISESHKGEKNPRCGVRLIGESNGMYGKQQSEYQKERVRQTMLNREYTPLIDEHKAKMSETRIKNGVAKGEKNPMYGRNRSGENNPMNGKKHSEETKQKMREAKLNNCFNRIVAIESGKKKYFSSISQAAQFYNTTYYKIKFNKVKNIVFKRISLEEYKRSQR